jgi:hypothetical protein
MALHEHAHHPPKSLAESVICFACMAGLLIAAAAGMQWLLHFLP